ncbi:MAG: hypothetical protein IJO26_05155 [Clostridium sp.]|nr:hypothetical protein [Clostridium sp.]
MDIVNSLSNDVKFENKEVKYFYRMTKENFCFGQAFGIEVEKQDFIEGKIVNLERDYIKKISNNKKKVNDLLELIYKYQVSPIHLIDILGEYTDNYVSDFNI